VIKEYEVLVTKFGLSIMLKKKKETEIFYFLGCGSNQRGERRGKGVNHVHLFFVITTCSS